MSWALRSILDLYDWRGRARAESARHARMGVDELRALAREVGHVAVTENPTPRDIRTLADALQVVLERMAADAAKEQCMLETKP